MFSEREIAIHCRQCKGHCEDIKNCPLKTEWAAGRKNTIFPALPEDWSFSSPECFSMQQVEMYSTEELINGLGKLNNLL
jgi:hypothetical protein